LLLAAFVEETREITLELAEESVEDLSLSEPAGDDRRGTPGSDAPQGAGAVEQRPARVEEQYLRLNAARAEREAMLDRLSSQGSILEYLINQQQKQFSQFDESLKKISGQIDRLRMLVLSQADQDIVRLDARKKESS
jgi:hypothetical protein